MYKAFPCFIFRTPFLSFDELSSRMRSEEALLAQMEDPAIEEALFLASPVLYSEIKKLIVNNSQEKKDKSRILSAMGRYMSRMSTRCTPFGLFAGYGIGMCGDDKTQIILSAQRERITRLDMYYLSALCDALFRIPEVRKKITYYPNSSLYALGKRYRYVETRYINQLRKYSIVEIESSDYLEEIITVARGGITIESLIHLLVDEYITAEEAEKYIWQLIESQVLVAELCQAVTGDDFFNRLITLLRRIGYNKKIVGQLQQIQDLLIQLDRPWKKQNMFVYREIEKRIKEINIPYEPRFLFQIDSVVHPVSATLSKDVVNEIHACLEFLNRINPIHSNSNLVSFKQAFYRKYEEQEVPLMEALDPEQGLRYPIGSGSGDPSPLIDDFVFPVRRDKESFQLTSFQRLLLEKIMNCRERNENEILLTDEDGKGGEVHWEDLPPTLATFFNIIGGDSGNLLLRFRSCGGSSAANLLGRFGHTSHQLQTLIKDIVQKEQESAPDKIFAEIVHLPESRVGNVVFRPHIREYEILYMSATDLPSEYQICMDDLMLSVRRGELVLRSKRLDKEIIPRLTTAHNYHYNTMPVYRFLCDMQHPQGRLGLSVALGTLEQMFSFIPRVRYKNTILSPAIWIVKEEELTKVFSLDSEETLLDAVNQWRKAREMPRYMILPDSDNELFIDWESVLSIRSLFSVIKKRVLIKFTEFIFEPDQAIITNSTKGYVNECIMAFYK